MAPARRTRPPPRWRRGRGPAGRRARSGTGPRAGPAAGPSCACPPRAGEAGQGAAAAEEALRSYLRPRLLVEDVDLGLNEPDVVEQVDDLVAVHLPALHQRLRNLLHRRLIALYQDIGRHERLTE